LGAFQDWIATHAYVFNRGRVHTSSSGKTGMRRELKFRSVVCANNANGNFFDVLRNRSLKPSDSAQRLYRHANAWGPDPNSKRTDQTNRSSAATRPAVNCIQDC
jgi:hypothetical protein